MSELCEKCGQDLFNPTALEAAIKERNEARAISKSLEQEAAYLNNKLVEERLKAKSNGALLSCCKDLSAANARVKELEGLWANAASRNVLERLAKIDNFAACNLEEPTGDDLPRIYSAYKDCFVALSAEKSKTARLESELEKSYAAVLAKGNKVRAEKAKSARLVEALKSFPMSHSRTCDSDKCYEYCPSELKRKALADYAEPQDEGKKTT